MNSLSVYASALELNDILAGSCISAIRGFPEGASIVLSKCPFEYLHILFHSPQPEFFPSSEPIAPESSSTREIHALEGSTIRATRPIGLNRAMVLEIEGSREFSSKEVFLRLDLSAATRPISYFPAMESRPAASIGRPGAKVPSSLEYAGEIKPYSLLSAPMQLPPEIAEFEHTARLPQQAPEHTKMWRKSRLLSSALMASLEGLDPYLAAALAEEAYGDAEKAWSIIRELSRKLALREWCWHLYMVAGEKRSTSWNLYPLELPFERPKERMSGFYDALATRARRVVIPSYTNHLRSRVSNDLRREIKKLMRLRNNLASDLSDAERASEYRFYGELLASNRYLLSRGMSEIVLEDFSGERSVKIPLDPARSPDGNVRFYFTKAKKGEKGAAIIRDRKRKVEEEIEKLRREIERIQSLSTPEKLLELLADKKERSAADLKETEKEGRFRKIRIDERYTAYVGRSEKENDILTHVFASPNDLWFHAQGVPGSHVILRGASRSTPATVIEKAAAIAAYFSKARTSRTVPVIYTEKRYVRRPRKSKPGVALCDRSKTIFVEPRLPESFEDE